MVNNIIKHFNWEKVGVYLAIFATFFTVLMYIAERRKLQTKQEKNS